MIKKIVLSASGIKTVLKEKSFFVLFVFSTLFSGFVSLFLLGAASFPDLLEGKLIVNPFLEFSGVIYLTVFPLLLGLTITLHYYKIKKISSKGIHFSSLAGFITGIFTTACPACPPVILSLLGITTAFAVLPFGGNEIRVLSIALLLISIYLVSLGIQKTCAIK